MHVVGEIARRSDDDDRDLWICSAAHEVRGNEDGPVHWGDRGRGIVRAVAHRDHRDTGGADRVPDPRRELAIDGDAHRDRTSPLNEVTGDGAGIDDRHRALDMDVVWRQHDRYVGTRLREAPTELLHPLGRWRGERRTIGGFGLWDRDGAMRSDAGEDERHGSEYARPKIDAIPRACSSTVEQGTFNPLVPGSNPGRLTRAHRLRAA